MQAENVREKYLSLLTDVGSLKEKPVPQIREKIAEKVAIYFNRGLLDSLENNIACDIIRMLARDVEVGVRKILAYNLRNSIILPHDIALRLGNDILEVAAPMLEFSPVITEEDLVTIIKSTTEVAKLIVISRRSDATEIVSEALINHVHEDVIVSLFLNDTAKISQDSLEFAFNNFSNSSKVIGALINRNDLADIAVENILNAISAELRNEFTDQNTIEKKKASTIIHSSQERIMDDVEDTSVTTSSIGTSTESRNSKSSQTENLVNHLFRKGRLTESLILRALCEGDLLFFEASMARRTGIPIINVRTLMQDGNYAALRSLWRRAKMPESTFDAMNIVINFAVSNLNNKVTDNHYSQLLLQHIQVQGQDRTTSIMPYVMALIASSVQIHDIV